ncbi:MAG: hypothetical protein ACJAY8_000743 [Sphingobacteriales bacterium]|jgi:hypothetical protein
MKKHFFRTALTVLCFSVIGLVSAQDAFEWDAHGIGFTLPDGFTVTSNSGEEFSGASENIFITMIPWNDADITEADLEDVVVQAASDMAYDDIHDAFDASVHDFVGVGVYGTKDGVDAVIAAILDTKSGTNMIIIIGYNSGYGEKAQAIYKSMYAYD